MNQYTLPILLATGLLIYFIWLRYFSGYYVPAGLAHSTAHLRDVADQIPYWSIERQSVYADAVARELSQNVAYCNEYAESVRNTQEVDFAKFNSTSVGNLAYMAKFSASTSMKVAAYDCLLKYQAWHQKNKRA
jgi:hypothetical protein